MPLKNDSYDDEYIARAHKHTNLFAKPYYPPPLPEPTRREWLMVLCLVVIAIGAGYVGIYLRGGL